MSVHSHLEKEVVEYLELPKQNRIEICQSDRWIGYTRAIEILDQLDNLVAYPKSIRPPNLLLAARSGNGKSSILERFAGRHPVQTTPTGTPIAPVLKVEMPETPNESEFWSAILWALAISHRDRDPTPSKKRQAKTILQYASVKILIIDEFNNLTSAGKNARDILAAIKGLSNDLKISIVAAGTKEAIYALNTEPQMKTRFEPAVLNPWKLNNECLRFLASYERLLPLPEASNLASRDLAPKIIALAGETIGGITKLLKAAAKKAVEEDERRITPALLDTLHWIRPGEWDEVARSV
jgi:hypothetical protein